MEARVLKYWEEVRILDSSDGSSSRRYVKIGEAGSIF